MTLNARPEFPRGDGFPRSPARHPGVRSPGVAFVCVAVFLWGLGAVRCSAARTFPPRDRHGAGGSSRVPDLASGSISVGTPADPVLQVGIRLGLKSLSLSSTNGMKISSGRARKRVETRFGAQAVHLRSHITGVAHPNGNVYAALVAEPLGGGILKVDGAGYRGSILVKPNGRGDLDVVNLVTLEAYLEGVIKAEMVASAPLEALKVQAIIARTFAIEKRNAYEKEGYGLKADEFSQVYKGVEGEDPRTRPAVRATRGVVMTHDGALVETLYHSSCGGMTEDNDAVWKSKPVTQLRTRPCPACRIAPPPAWSVSLSYSEIMDRLRERGQVVHQIRDIGLTRTRTGRIATVIIKGSPRSISMSGNDFRIMMGSHRLKSLNADAVGSAPDPPPATASAADLQIRSVISGYMVRAHRESGPVLRLQGRGSGHGVGLCQHGAEILAQRGLDARKILEHYYQEFELRRLR